MQVRTYAENLATAYKVNWRIEDVLGSRRFDPSKRWLPLALSAAPALRFLDDYDRRALTQIELAAYAHLFGFAEEFIAPKVSCLAHDFEIENRPAFDALTQFAAEEVKHMNLFRAVRARVGEQLGFEPALLGGEKEAARLVLGKSTGAVLMLTSAIEWLTQRHFVESVRDDAELDPLVKGILRAHWQEEAQHAQIDALETIRAFNAMTPAERDRAVDETIELVAAVDGWLSGQTALDVENLARLLGRKFDAHETNELRREILAAKRKAFLMDGVTHPRFQELFGELTTPEQRARVGKALEGLFRTEAAAAA